MPTTKPDPATLGGKTLEALEAQVAQAEDAYQAEQELAVVTPFAAVDVAEIERRRELVEAEPDTTVDTPGSPSAPLDEDEKEEPPPADPEGEALFDRTAYDSEELALPKVDGQGLDKIAVAFKGRILLDRSDPSDVALFRSLALGKEVELRVAGEVVSTKTGWTTNRDGDLDAIVGERAINVGTVWVLDPEQL